MEKWFIRNNIIDFKKISNDLNLDPIIAKILVNRNIDKIEAIDRFLNPDINKLHNPKTMNDLEKASDIIIKKIKNNEKIRIVGDFDVDGIMSVYILYKSLLEIGGRVDYGIPHRVEEGYGINKDIIKKAKDDNIGLIITCDNGISATEEVAYAKEIGLDIIITDHHDLPLNPPNADAVVNPKNRQCKYPFKLLCGAGVAFKLMEHVYKVYKTDKDIYNYLEFVAIATICDVVDLIDENRIIVKNGLENLNNTKNLGLKVLIEILEIKKIEAYHVGFIIGPSINATGRLDTAYMALDLLLTEDSEEAYKLSYKLKMLNEERKALTEEGTKKVIEIIENTNIKYMDIFVVYEKSIHESIAGIISGRIKDLYNRPTIVLTMSESKGVKGSARSIEEYNIFEALCECKDLLNRFGGHPMAAGLSLDESNIDKISKRLNENSSLKKEDLIKKIKIDLGLPLGYIDYKLIDNLYTLEPYGKGNPKPIFGAKDLKILRIFKLGSNKDMFKLRLKSKDNTVYDGILFNGVGLEDKITLKYGKEELENAFKGIDNNISIDLLYYPSLNTYNGSTNIQIIIQNYRF